nr:hypothetical protein [uncultured Fluviicola sp.]
MTTSTRTKTRLVNEKNEVTILQRIGVVMIIAGLLGLIISLFFHSDKAKDLHPDAASAPIAAISFFITMLGVAFAFPTMLRGKGGISTMRIVVFMMANVICMLLIKCGWQVNSLQQIGLDEWWMGVIAFVFGAKATQSYFESKLAVPGAAKVNSEILSDNSVNTGFASEAVAKQAILQNRDRLKYTHKNISGISDLVKNPAIADSHVVAIYVKDDQVDGIDKQLKANMQDGEKSIATEIIKNCGESGVQLDQKDSVSKTGAIDADKGSICCAVKSRYSKSFKGIVTSGHIFTDSRFNSDNNGVLDDSLQTDVYFNEAPLGKWFYKELSDEQDLIIVKLNNSNEPTTIKQFNDRYYDVTQEDVYRKTELKILSRNGKLTTGYIVNSNVEYEIGYFDQMCKKTNIILLSSSRDDQNPAPISVKGDSGSCVYIHDEGGDKMIGILVGADNKFSFVHPIKNTLYSSFEII